MYRKIFVFFMMCICISLMLFNRSYALGYGDSTGRYDVPEYMFDNEQLSSESTKDDVGHIQSGYFFYTFVSGSVEYYKNEVFKADNGYLYVTYKRSHPEFYSGGVDSFEYTVWCTSSLKDLSVDVSFPAGSVGNPSPEILLLERDKTDSGFVRRYFMNHIIDKDVDVKDIEETIATYCTNLPVFDETNQEAIETYISNGDYSGAINSDDIDTPPVEYDELVEKPKNLRTYGNVENVLGPYDTTGRITVRWDVPQNQIDSYSYDVQVRSCYIYAGKPVWTGWNTKVSDFPYNGHDVYDLTTGEKVNRSTTLPEDFIVTQKILYENVPSVPDNLITGVTRYSIKDFEVRVRNRSGGRCSNWVSTKVSADNKHITTVTDDNGNVVDDEDYNGQDVNNSNQDTYYDTDYQDGGTNGIVNTDNVSVTSILGFIKSGFGLLGDNGIIALMSRTYLYLPASIWTIIKFFVAMLVVIAIIGAIKEVL